MTKVRYSKTIPEPDRVMAEIAKTRSLMLEAGSKVRPQGPAYHALHVVTAAIDGLAAFISGERHYFANRYHTSFPNPKWPPQTLDLDTHPHETPEEIERPRYKE